LFHRKTAQGPFIYPALLQKIVLFNRTSLAVNTRIKNPAHAFRFELLGKYYLIYLQTLINIHLCSSDSLCLNTPKRPLLTLVIAVGIPHRLFKDLDYNNNDFS